MRCVCVFVYVCDVLLFPTDVCSDSSSEESVETLSEQITLSEFVIKPGEDPLRGVWVWLHHHQYTAGTALQLQGHLHWLLELAIKLVSTLSSGNITAVRLHTQLEPTSLWSTDSCLN